MTTKLYTCGHCEHPYWAAPIARRLTHLCARCRIEFASRAHRSSTTREREWRTSLWWSILKICKSLRRLGIARDMDALSCAGTDDLERNAPKESHAPKESVTYPSSHRGESEARVILEASLRSTH